MFMITLSEPTTVALSIQLAWAGAASLQSDFDISVSGGTLAANKLSINLAPGVTSATILLTPTDDKIVEGAETVSLAVAAGSGYTLDVPGPVAATIADNDSTAISIANASIDEGNTGTRTVTLTVTLTNAMSTALTLGYATATGTAGGGDFQAKTGVVTIAAGSTTATITVAVVGDKLKENNETFTVALSGALPAFTSFSKSSATVTILDDERPQLAAEAAPAGAAVPISLTAEQLDAVVSTAKAQWISARPTADFSGVSVSIAELDGELLAITAGTEITIDATAAGWGWGPGAATC